MGRRGEFYDQDGKESPESPDSGPGAPLHAGAGALYDQDGGPEPERRDLAALARRREALERQRERELEWRRDTERDREREARRRKAREAEQRTTLAPPRPPVRISSRPGDSQTIAGSRGRPPAERVSPAPEPGPLVWPPPPPPPPLSEREEGRDRQQSPVREPGRPAPPPAQPQAPPPAQPQAPPPAQPQAPPPAQPQAPPVRRQPTPPSTEAPPDVRRPPTTPNGPPPTPPGATQPAAAAARTRRAPSGPRPQSTSRATLILAGGTFASRVTGFIRVLAIGYVLGVSTLSDAFNYANGVPNIVYDLVLGGVLSATLVPVFVEQFRTTSRTESRRAVSAVLTAVALALAVISAVLWFLAPWIIHFYLVLNHQSSGAAERELATRLLHFFAPQVFFLGGIVVTTALLNARRQFTVPAFSPVLNNLVAIGALLATKAIASSILTAPGASATTTLARFTADNRALWVLGIGTTAGYLVQLLVQLPAVRRAGLSLRPVWDPHHPAVRRVAHLSSWLVGVVVANQVSLALVMVLAARETGGVTAYQFAYQFFQLPYALVTVSVASALMPDLSERWTNGDRRGFQRQFIVGLRVVLAILTPVALIYAVVAQPFIQLAVHHGRVTQSGAHLVSTSLALFAIGLPGFSGFFLLMRAYQAMQQARAMFWIYAIENAMTVVAALVIEPVLGVQGLALAWVGPYTIASFIAAADLRRRLGRGFGKRTGTALVRVGIASGVAAGVTIAAGLLFPSSAQDPVVVGRLVTQLVVGTAAYLAMAWLLGIKELRAVWQLLRRATGRRSTPPSRPRSAAGSRA